MEYLPILGFLLAGYAVIANDSLQTLGTWLNSNKDIKWYWLWGFASSHSNGSCFLWTILGRCHHMVD